MAGAQTRGYGFGDTAASRAFGLGNGPLPSHTAARQPRIRTGFPLVAGQDATRGGKGAPGTAGGAREARKQRDADHLDGLFESVFQSA
ncbi:hypothetical protein GCM10010298_33090 [Streptomyces microflavus]|uniref:Uncharacterized protein n=1 Tax=Streptomyces microflavus TaxID=1919 RepID=A0A7J0CIE9_STRMI|nr:hypothetical protein Smic_00630 [Streptomyces microflavus]GGX65921.1 hypothetical protein GCM10010298_33090 [Streptomyces microflavus]